MISPAEEYRFYCLAAVLERSREQQTALIDQNLERFGELAQERRALVDALAAPPFVGAEFPDNLTPAPTALLAREEEDTRLAIDLVVRAVLDQDQRNEAVLEATLNDLRSRSSEVGRHSAGAA